MRVQRLLSDVLMLQIVSREEQDENDPDAAAPSHGHVTSISVLRPYRRLGLARTLMLQSRALCFEQSTPRATNVRTQRTQWPPRTARRSAVCTFENPIAPPWAFTGTLWAFRSTKSKRNTVRHALSACAVVLTARVDADGEDALAMRLDLSARNE